MTNTTSNVNSPRAHRSDLAADPIRYGGSVWWLDEAMGIDPGTPCPPLSGDVHADVCIVGGGYTGLWTAIEILQEAPETRVVVLEAGSCGFGASGRNGGWVSGWHDELDALIKRFGTEEGLRLAARSAWAIDRLEAFSGEWDIDCHFRRNGAYKAAVTKAQIGSWRPVVELCREHGRGTYYEEVSGEEVRRKIGSKMPLAAVCQTDGGTLQPALLARGLRRVALELGARIYESTPMIGLDRGTPCCVRTPAGSVVADRVALAAGVWMARMRELRRAIVPVGSSILVTEPLSRLAALPAAQTGEGVGDRRLTVHYIQVTADGRLVFGRGGGPLGPRGRVLPEHMHDARTLRSMVSDMHRWFPDLKTARITHAWSGPVDRAPGHLPFLGHLGDHENIVYASGLSGQGVGQCAFIGRVLGRLALGIDDEDTRSPMTWGPPAYLPPEPLRSLGGALVREAVERVEEAEELHGRSLHLNRVFKRLIKVTVPAWLEPRRTAA